MCINYPSRRTAYSFPSSGFEWTRSGRNFFYHGWDLIWTVSNARAQYRDHYLGVINLTAIMLARLVPNPHSPYENTHDCTLAFSGPSHLQTVKHWSLGSTPYLALIPFASASPECSSFSSRFALIIVGSGFLISMTSLISSFVPSSCKFNSASSVAIALASSEDFSFVSFYPGSA